jgi:predicted transposase YdaD
MALPFDATLKDLVTSYPQDWLAAIGRPGEARLISPELSSVSADADLVFEREDRLFHLEAQTGPDPDLPRRVLRHNVLLHERFGLPVESFVILLRRRADRGDLIGRVQYGTTDGRSILDFRFEVLRLWQRPYAEMLAGGLGMVPLAVLGALPDNVPKETALEAVVEQVKRRILTEAPAPEVGKLLMASFILTGLRVPQDVLVALYQGVVAMRDSSGYQVILNEGVALGVTKGRVQEALHILLLQGRDRFGEPDPSILAALTATNDTERLEMLAKRILRVSSWEELLANS